MAKSPNHYTRGDIEVWDFIRDQGLNYFRGNAIKYICRAGFKSTHTEIEDLQKAIHYLENELQHALSQSKSAGASTTIPNCIWDEEWDCASDYATGFDR
tara:strand:+ start:1708 stop:2004 length:297 start_codon:yes stop_codon:yes gene_type:complete